MTDLQGRVGDLERLLKVYRDECASSNVELGKKLDRVMAAALGDEAMGVIGFVELHRRQHREILDTVDKILDAQAESRMHRAQYSAVPLELVALRKKVDTLEIAAHDNETTVAAYKRMMGWIIVIINGSWAAGVAVWKFLL